MCVFPQSQEKCVASQAHWRQLGVMQYKTFDDDYSLTPQMEQALSTRTQQEASGIRNSWRELLEIVDSYLARHGVDGW
jgi:hypothetical protein